MKSQQIAVNTCFRSDYTHMSLELKSHELTLTKKNWSVYRGSDMSAHVLLNLLNELRKRDQMQGLTSI